ncbi:MAG: excisionase family DNA-binding protein, partial [Actinomycetota bacterium]
MSERSVPLPVAVRPVTAARLLDCSRAHVYQLMERGEMRRLQISGSKSVRIPLEDVYAVLGLDAPESTGHAG